MLKRFILASVLATGALAAGPQSASAAPIGFSAALVADAAPADVTQVQYYYGPPRPYWRRRFYRPYGYYRPRPFYRPYGYYYRPRPYYRPFY